MTYAASPEPRPNDHATGDSRETAPGNDAEALGLRLAELQNQVADIGHELKTPATIALGLAERMASEGTLLPAERRDAERILTNVRLVQIHLHSLLVASGIDGARHAGTPPTSDIAQIVRRTARDLQPLAREHGLHLRVEAPIAIEAQIDPVHVVVMLSNLLINAIRSTPLGGVVRCTLGVGDRLRIEVADSGPGILDQRPSRTSAPVDHHPEQPLDSLGLGLGRGLEIVRRLAARYDGNLVIGRAPEGGALVTVRLLHHSSRGSDDGGFHVASASAPTELVRITSTSAVETTTVPNEVPLVLLVCDDPVVGDGHLRTLHADGPREIAVAGPEAGAETAGGPVPDIVVVDLRRADPLAVVRALRGEAGNDDLPIVVLVPPQSGELRTSLLRQGADDVPTATMTEQELRARVDVLLARRRRTAEQRRASGRFRHAFFEAPIGTGIATLDGAWREVNPALCALTETPAAELRRLRVDSFDHPADRLLETAELHRLLEGQTRGFQIEKRWRVGARRTLWVRLSYSAERDDLGLARGLIVQVEDVTSAHRRQTQLKRQANHDQLTDLLNRRGLLHELKRRSNRDSPTTLLVLEINDLPAINARFGHHIGDEILQAAGRSLRGTLGRAIQIARIAGAEFAAIIPHTDAEALTAVQRAITAALRDTQLGEQPSSFALTAVFGATTLVPGEALTTTIARANAALNRDRRSMGQKSSPGGHRRLPREDGHRHG